MEECLWIRISTEAEGSRFNELKCPGLVFPSTFTVPQSEVGKGTGAGVRRPGSNKAVLLTNLVTLNE